MKLSKEQKRVLFLSATGGMLEFYDFTIYGIFASYFTRQFFPSNDHFITIIAGYSVFVIGYVVRPLGGIIFSHIGDEIGRKIVLVLTMVLMGVAALGLGLLPTYAQIGVAAPILMILLRLLQGLAVGGELPSMIVYIIESIPHHSAFAMGTVFSGTVAGLIPGMLINLLISHYLTVEEITSFGWRIPFILGGFLCLVAYQIRSKLHETKAFDKVEERTKFPLAELINHHFGSLLTAMGLVAMMAAPIVLALIFMPTYLVSILHFNPARVSNAILTATVISIIATYAMGLLASRFSLYGLMQKGILLLPIAAGACYFFLFKEKSLILPLGIFALFQGSLVTLPPVLIGHLFPTEIRLTGIALSYNLAFVIFGGLAPLLITSAIKHTSMLYLPPFFYLLIVSSLALVALSRYRKQLPK